MPRKRLSDSEKKITKQRYNKKYYLLHTRTLHTRKLHSQTLHKQYHLHLKLKINKKQRKRWDLVKERLNLISDEEVVEALLDSFCGTEEIESDSSLSTSETIPDALPIPSTSIWTPIVTPPVFPYFYKVSSNQSSDSDHAMNGLLTPKEEIETLP